MGNFKLKNYLFYKFTTFKERYSSNEIKSSFYVNKRYGYKIKRRRSEKHDERNGRPLKRKILWNKSKFTLKNYPYNLLSRVNVSKS